jgi:hypothetical protein
VIAAAFVPTGSAKQITVEVEQDAALSQQSLLRSHQLRMCINYAVCRGWMLVSLLPSVSRWISRS